MERGAVTMDNFKMIYKILTYLEKSMDFEEPSYSCIDPEHLNIPYPYGKSNSYNVHRSDDGPQLRK